VLHSSVALLRCKNPILRYLTLFPFGLRVGDA
jgi:hypothetical protein